MDSSYLEDKVFCSVTQFNEFGHKVAEFCGQKEDIDHVMKPQVFSSDEFCPHFDIPIYGKTVYISATPSENVNPQDMSMRISLTAAAAKENGAEKVVLLAPLLFYTRQDRGPREDAKFVGEPNSTLVQARNFKANGIDQILTVHLHSRTNYAAYGEAYFPDEIKKFTENKARSEQEIEEKKEDFGRQVLYNLNPNPIFAHYLRFRSSLMHECDKEAPGKFYSKIRKYDGKKLPEKLFRQIEDYSGENIVFMSPDLGAKYHIYDLQGSCFLPDSQYCNFEKLRGSPNNPSDMTVELNQMSDNFNGLEDKIVIVADDMVDTGGTITNSLHALMNNNQYGKPEAVIMVFTHPVLAGQTIRSRQHNIGSVRPREIVTMNTLPYIEYRRNPGWKRNSSVLRLAAYMGDAISSCIEQQVPPQLVYNYDSLEDLMSVERLYDIKSSTMHFLGGR